MHQKQSFFAASLLETLPNPSAQRVAMFRVFFSKEITKNIVFFLGLSLSLSHLTHFPLALALSSGSILKRKNWNAIESRPVIALLSYKFVQWIQPQGSSFQLIAAINAVLYKESYTVSSLELSPERSEIGV